MNYLLIFKLYINLLFFCWWDYLTHLTDSPLLKHFLDKKLSHKENNVNFIV
jgi:hypothetical protein